MPYNLSFNVILKYGLAYLALLVLFLLSLSNFSSWKMNLAAPYFIVAVIYYWSIYRPAFINPIILFVCGIIVDLVLSYPVAFHAILFIGLNWIIKKQRLFLLGQSYGAVWLGFFVTCLAVLSLEYIFFGLLTSNFGDVANIAMTGLFTVLFFPLLTLLFTFLHRMLPLNTDKGI